MLSVFPLLIKTQSVYGEQSHFSSRILDFIASEFSSLLRNMMTAVRNTLVIQEGLADICSVE